MFTGRKDVNGKPVTLQKTSGAEWTNSCPLSFSDRGTNIGYLKKWAGGYLGIGKRKQHGL